MDAQALSARWQEVQDKIAQAAAQSGRRAQDVRLVAVSKGHGVQSLKTLYHCGQRIFGENYVQEAQQKIAGLPADIIWHFLGHLQTNKVKHVVGVFDLIHGVDSLRLARSLQRRAQALNCVQNILVQVNLGGEAQKNGVLEKDLPCLAEFLVDAPNLHWQGLMLMPPFFGDPLQAQPFFARLRTLAQELSHNFGIALPELSMGMTDDFEMAIAHGATLVRVGTKIFGPRL